MMKTFTFFLLTFFCISASAQTITDSVFIAGNTRYFHYAASTKKKATPSSLLFIMHGSGGSATSIMPQAAKLQAIADRENLVIIYPDGYKKFWNECRLFSNAEANKINIDEQAFFQQMITYAVKQFNVDPSNVFAAGFSGGGHMAYKLGLTMPGTFRAVSAIVANMPDSASNDCIASGKPLPILIINGTDDKTNPDAGGEMFVNNASFGVVLSSASSFNYWAKLAGYTGAPEIKKLPDTDPNDKRTIETYTYKAPGKPEIQRLRVIGGGHDYPGDIDVYSYAWEFFKRQMIK